MATSFQTTQLDFASIKDNLKTHFQRQSEFADYDFEGSGLSNLLDVLAYNTHYNSLLANFSLNEAYLTSAQLRSSVVSIAQTLGYDIRSRTAASANLNISVNLSSALVKPSSISLPQGTKFTASVDGISYVFQTLSTFTATNDGSNIYAFVDQNGSTDIPVYEGQLKTKTYIVQEDNERQVFIIPDETIDTSTAVLKVYDTYSSTSFVSYTNVIYATSINPESTFYRILETPKGGYEISFGDGVTTGVKPVVGNKVELTYLSCVGPDANKASSFSPISQIDIGGTNYDVSVSVSSASSGGAKRQSIESIRQNAPLSFAAQQRLVTAEDYKTTILTRFSSVSDVVAWGGEDNDPPNYGVVYVGILYNDGVSDTSKTAIQDAISTVLNENLAILSIDVAFVDPIITYLQLETEFAFNPNLTSVTRNTIESLVSAEVNQYATDNLKTFGGIFRKSNLTTKIDDISPAILSTKVTAKLQQRLTPISVATDDDNSQITTYKLYFPVELASPDDVNYTIISTSFNYNGVNCKIKNKLNSTKLQIVDSVNIPIVDNIGTYTPSTGKVELVGFAPGVITSGDSFIKITATPAKDNVIKPLRNYYFDIDTSSSFAISTVDRGTTDVSLT